MKHVITVMRGSDQVSRIYPDRFIRLEGYKAWMQIRRTKGSEIVLDELTTDNDRIKILGSMLLLTFPHEVTKDWAFRRGVFDIKVISPEGGEIRVAEGNILVIPEVTR